MNIVWIISVKPGVRTGFYELSELDDDFRTLASLRYRAIIPADELMSRGYNTRFYATNVNENDQLFLDSDIDVAVFTKMSTPDMSDFIMRSTHWLKLAEQLKSKGVRIVADTCDNHFDKDTIGDYLKNIIELSDKSSCSTNAMSEVIEQRTGRKSIVIGDAVDVMQELPHYSDRLVNSRSGFLSKFLPGYNKRHIRLLWFGHQMNLPTVECFIPSLMQLSKNISIQLTIVTSPGFGAEELCTTINGLNSARFIAEFVEWSLESARESLVDCDVVIIPSDPEEEKYSVKSPNRLTNSIWAGAFVVASPLPSYLEFKDYAWIGRNLIDGIKWVVRNRHSINKRISEGQSYVESTYMPGVIAGKWQKLFSSIL